MELLACIEHMTTWCILNASILILFESNNKWIIQKSDLFKDLIRLVICYVETSATNFSKKSLKNIILSIFSNIEIYEES